MGGDVADEAAGEAVAGAGGVDHGLERETPAARRSPSSVIMAAPYSPCLATITCGPHSRIWRAARTRFGSRGQLPQLGVVEQHAVDASEIVSISESRAMSIHRFIESSATNRALRALARGPARWRSGWMLARKSDVRAARDVGELGLEVGEHVQLGVERLAVVEVPAVLAAPEERPVARHVLDVVGVDAPGAQDGVLLLAEVIRRPGRPRGRCRRTTPRARNGPRSRRASAPGSPNGVLDRVERDRAYDRDGHEAG